MKKLLLSLTTLALLGGPVLADPEIDEWKTPHSMGCLMVRDCQDDTYAVKTTSDIEQYITHTNYDQVRTEADSLITELNKLGVNVYLAYYRYCQRSVAGIYYVTGNNLFLNQSWIDDPINYIQTLRH